MPFDPEYVRLVLDENFEDAKAWFLTPLMALHAAHLVMLSECRIIPLAEARRIRDGLGRIDLNAVRATKYDGIEEDLFFHIEARLAAACGPEAAGYLHTARSRNDIDMTLYRLRLRDLVLALAGETLRLRRVLLDVADAHRDALFPAHTHTQPAQPTTLAHYLVAAVEHLERDTTRLLAAFAQVNRSPLGACAITGTGFPIDRVRTSDLLGFNGPTGNTYGSIAAADYLLEPVGVIGVALVGLGRLIQDLLLWCTNEFGYVRLPDDLVQTSSVMPQKRNPVPLEHARALASKALGQALAMPLTLHNTPFGDIVDSEDDIQPLVTSMFKDAARAFGLVALAVRRATFDTARMRERASLAWITVTELADTLARDHELPFRAAHAIAAAVVRNSTATPGASIVDLVASASAGETGHAIRFSADQMHEILSPEHFVRVRRTLGGPAPERIAEAIHDGRAQSDRDDATVAAIKKDLATAAARLDAAVAAL